ncbi:MAG: hypothetical protein COB65_05695 [Thalassobium sp.]|nr:MAG: hypothetical protein COB65_05695 [Thalassobium sp.]
MVIDGFWWMAMASVLAGTVYGFAGFGAALIFMPIAVMVVDPVVAVTALSVSALSSFVTLVPQAWREADKRAVLTMLGTAIAFVPLGIWLLRTTDPTVLRWSVSILALATLVILLTGWRYRQTPGTPAWLGVGAGVGFLGGATGLNGPILILFQLGGQDEIARTRANTIVVLTCSGLAYLPFLALQGALTQSSLIAGAAQLIPYGAGALVGRQLFNPGKTGLYRTIAYIMIGAAAFLGLPIWGT